MDLEIAAASHFYNMHYISDVVQAFLLHTKELHLGRFYSRLSNIPTDFPQIYVQCLSQETALSKGF
jgi:hypothetical protein